MPGLVSALLLQNRSPYLAALTAPMIAQFRRQDVACPWKGSARYGIHRAIATLGIVDPPTRSTGGPVPAITGMEAPWQAWVERWVATSPLTRKVRQTFRTILFKVGRWLAQQQPEIREPAHWTRELCADYLAHADHQPSSACHHC